MTKIINFFDKYFFETVLIILTLICLFNGYFNIGLWHDGAWYILNTVQNTPSIEHTRFFVSFLLSLPTYFINLLNINNIEKLLCIFPKL